MPDANRPVYLRLRDIIMESILDGVYGDGDILPSVRAFAAQQGANPLTVAKAYQSFQDDDLITVRRGVGMFVAPGATKKMREMERDRFLNSIWPPVVEQMRRVGLSLDQLQTRERA